MSDKVFFNLIGVLYLLPLPLLWLVFWPSSFGFALAYLGLSGYGLWQAIESFKEAKEAGNLEQDKKRTGK